MTVPTRQFNTPRGTVKVSTPEATAIDLIGYADKVGGMDMAATVLSDLAEAIEPLELQKRAKDAPIVWLQRLGHLLDHVHRQEVSRPLLDLVADKARDYTPLVPNRLDIDSPRDKRWKVSINTDVEVEF